MTASSTQVAEHGEESTGFPSVFGKYVLLRSKARGGMGELFVALAGDIDGFEKLCIVKKVLHNLEDAGVHRRFLDEAKVVVRLNHSNLVQVFDAGRVTDEYYLAMELVEGKDLRAVWNRCAQLHRRIPVDFAIFVMREVARGLDYVHDAKGLELVHRDISPPNILIGYHGEVKLTDFGLAKSAIKREMTRPGVVFGRYSYLSPEQARGLPADRRTDIYAAGIVLWELLTGRQLFPSSNRSHKEALAAVRNPVVQPPSKVVPGIPPGLDEIVLKSLAKDRDDRYPSAGPFRTELSEVLNRHFPTCDADRVSDFMRDIFAREYKMERTEYGGYLRTDFREIRARAENTETISISDVILMSASGSEAEAPLESEPILLDDGDIVELDEPGAGAVDMDMRSLRAQARAWVGKVVAQRYRADALIGVGGMGAVFSATHLALGKSFALKILHRMYTRNSDIISRFLREARAASQTGHPNIVDVIDVGTTGDGDVYIAMELLEGRNLSNVVGRSGPLAVRRAVHIARQICRALSAAHEAGIIHRDLKSENVFLTTKGSDPDFVKVLDFGICKQTNADVSDTSPGIVLGSPDYMSPEQGAGKEATPASDIYAVGVILFEMLAGELPFLGDSPVETLSLKASEDAPRVTEKRAEVPNALADVVDQCLQRRATDRPPSMRVLEYELTRAVDGRASAVAAVLGLNMPGEEAAGASSASLSRSGELSPATVAGVADLADAEGFDNLQTTAVKRAPKRPKAAKAPGSIASGFKAIMFVALGGLLAGGAVLALSPSAIDDVVGEGGGAPAAPEPAALAPAELPPEPTAAEPPVPGSVPPPTPVPAQAVAPAEAPPAELAAAPEEAAAPTPAPGSLTAVDRVGRAQAALENKHWREPPEGSLALELANIGLLDPGSEAIARLREQAAAELLPLGEAAMAKKRWMEAANAFRDLRAVWPENVEAREKLAEALLRQGRVLARLKDHEGSLKSADELLNLQPGDFTALMMRGNALMALEHWADAKDAYGAARKAKPRSKAAKKGHRRAGIRAKKASTASPGDGN